MSERNQDMSFGERQLMHGPMTMQSVKARPIAGEIASYPKCIYKFDRTFKIIESAAQLAELMAENENPKAHGQKHATYPVWAESPMSFGVETHPSQPEIQSRPGTW